MERENGNGNKIILTVIGAATLLVALVGATFAYFSATSEKGDPVEIQTGTSNISLTATGTNITGISPTTFEDESSASSNKDIAKVHLKVSGTGNTSGKYDISMKYDDITIGKVDSEGDITDLKYAVYKNGAVEKSETSFNETGETVTILDDIEYTGTINDEYDVYVWINNKASSQNNLQDLGINLTFTANASSSVQ